MPLYMDVHAGLGDATEEDVAAAHQRDLEVQGKYGVRFLTYWLNNPDGRAYCLVEAPSQDTAVACHKEAHGLLPHEMIEVDMPTIAAFLGDEWKQSAPDQARVSGPGSDADTGLRAIMFTDMEGSTDISTRHGDEVAVRALKLHDGVVRDSVSERGGREVKHTGDGLFASFSSVTSAVDCTRDIHRRLAAVEGSADVEPSVRVRIGLSAGEPVAGSDDLYGAAVNLAARICAHASPRQTLASGAVRELSIGKPFVYNDIGVVALKGFQEPVRIYEVPWED
jgi:class 3 adenylate cyclase